MNKVGAVQGYRTWPHGCEPHFWLHTREDGILPYAGAAITFECAF